MLVPTKELSEQVASHIRVLLKYCEKEVAVANVAQGTSTHLQKCASEFLALSTFSDILLAEPYLQISRILSSRRPRARSLSCRPRSASSEPLECNGVPDEHIRPSRYPHLTASSSTKPILFSPMVTTRMYARYSRAHICRSYSSPFS